MNRKMLGIAVLMLAVLIVLVAPAQAGPPGSAAGVWEYFPIPLEVKEAGCNTFVRLYEDGIWTGTFVGNSTEDGQLVVHCTGKSSFKATVSFQAVTVDGKSGGLEMSVVGRFPAGGSEWTGRWVITSGSGELRHLHGQGTWWGPGSPGPYQWGYLEYAGNYHFSPN